MNPLFNMMGGAKPSVKIDPQTIATAKRMMNMLNAAKNPGATLTQVAGQNPTLATVLKLCGNRDPKAVFYELCEKNGIDPDEILNQLKG